MRGLWITIAACTGPTGDTAPDDTDETPPGLTDPECADPVYFDATVRGKVTRGGAPAVGAAVRLEERFWAPGTVHGEGTTGEQGEYSFLATEMPIIEGCWGWATGFYVEAEQDGLYDDWGVNSSVTSAWIEGKDTIELDGIVLELE